MTATFATTPIGPSLAAINDGLLLTTLAAELSLARTARGTIGRSSGVHRVEFALFGDGDMRAAIGVLTSSASLSAMVGGDAQGIGWRLDAGIVYVGNSIMASDLPVPSKGEIVGLQIDIDAGSITFYRGAEAVHTRSLGIAGATWYFGASLGSAESRDLGLMLNAGQWRGLTLQAGEGWHAPKPYLPPLRLSDLDHLTGAADAPAHARYEGILDAAALETYAALHWWPWGDAGAMGGVASVRVHDADGQLDALALADVRGVPVSIRRGTLA